MATANALFMSIAAAVSEVPGKSFEEVRVGDYLKAYNSTRRPPQPCPQEPIDESKRRALNLPPLFKPIPEPPTFANFIISLSTPAPPSTNPADLPDAQSFSTRTLEGEVYNSITAAPLYQAFSFEELRYYAYLKGNRLPPLTIQAATDTTFNQPTVGASPPESDIMQSICCQPAFAGHSFEELRIAYMLAGKELNSSEILAVAAQTAASVPPAPPLLQSSLLAGGSAGGLALRPPAVQPFKF